MLVQDFDEAIKAQREPGLPEVARLAYRDARPYAYWYDFVFLSEDCDACESMCCIQRIEIDLETGEPSYAHDCWDELS